MTIWWQHDYKMMIITFIITSKVASKVVCELQASESKPLSVILHLMWFSIYWQHPIQTHDIMYQLSVAINSSLAVQMRVTMTEPLLILEHKTSLECQRVTQDTCDLWDICSERWGDMTWPKRKKTMTKTKTNIKTNTNTKTKTKTKTMPNTNTLREHPQRANLKTCDLWGICNCMTKKAKTRWQWQWQCKIQIHLENNFKERC